MNEEESLLESYQEWFEEKKDLLSDDEPTIEITIKYKPHAKCIQKRTRFNYEGVPYEDAGTFNWKTNAPLWDNDVSFSFTCGMEERSDLALIWDKFKNIEKQIREQTDE